MISSRNPLRNRLTLKGAARALACTLCAWVSFSSTGSVFASVPNYSVEDLTRLSTDVVSGVITGESAAWEPWNNGGRVIVTTYTVDVSDRLKGETPREIQVVIPGGTVGETHMIASCTPALETGRAAVFFLKKDMKGLPRYWVYGLERGVFDLDTDGLARPQVSDLAPMPLPTLKALVTRIDRADDGRNR